MAGPCCGGHVVCVCVCARGCLYVGLVSTGGKGNPNNLHQHQRGSIWLRPNPSNHPPTRTYLVHACAPRPCRGCAGRVCGFDDARTCPCVGVVLGREGKGKGRREGRIKRGLLFPRRPKRYSSGWRCLVGRARPKQRGREKGKGPKEKRREVLVQGPGGTGMCVWVVQHAWTGCVVKKRGSCPAPRTRKGAFDLPSHMGPMLLLFGILRHSLLTLSSSRHKHSRLPPQACRPRPPSPPPPFPSSPRPGLLLSFLLCPPRPHCAPPRGPRASRQQPRRPCPPTPKACWSTSRWCFTPAFGPRGTARRPLLLPGGCARPQRRSSHSNTPRVPFPSRRHCCSCTSTPRMTTARPAFPRPPKTRRQPPLPLCCTWPTAAKATRSPWPPWTAPSRSSASRPPHDPNVNHRATSFLRPPWRCGKWT